jgi:hypothetical protein
MEQIMNTMRNGKNLDGISQKLDELSNQLVEILNKAMTLEIYADWYDVLDPEWGGPPTQAELRKTAQELRKIYMSLASLTGLDPCEQFEEKLQNINQLRAVSVAYE